MEFQSKGFDMRKIFFWRCHLVDFELDSSFFFSIGFYREFGRDLSTQHRIKLGVLVSMVTYYDERKERRRIRRTRQWAKESNISEISVVGFAFIIHAAPLV